MHIFFSLTLLDLVRLPKRHPLPLLVVF